MIQALGALTTILARAPKAAIIAVAVKATVVTT
jgi:hypothetical protein